MDDRDARRTVGLATLGVELAMLPGLALAVVQLATDGNVLCPTDASCSAPYSAVALVGAPVLTGLTGFVTRSATRGRWPLRVFVPVLVVLAGAVLALVLAGATYRMDVPRP